MNNDIYFQITICETGIHMKRNVAVHPDISPTNLTPSSESFPVLACSDMFKDAKINVIFRSSEEYWFQIFRLQLNNKSQIYKRNNHIIPSSQNYVQTSFWNMYMELTVNLRHFTLNISNLNGVKPLKQ